MSASLARLSLEERHILRYAAAARSAPMVVPMGHACPDCARAAAAATVCAGCGAKPRDGVKLRLCSACRAVAYCGDACRLTHWVRACDVSGCRPKKSVTAVPVFFHFASHL